MSHTLTGVRIVHDIESLAASKTRAGSHHVTGVVSVEVDGVSHPHLSWTDDVDSLLSYWRDRCRHLQSGGKTADFALFNEPEGFLVTCDDGVCSIDLYRRIGRHRQIILSTRCGLDVLVSDIARCSKQVWSACVRHGWSSDHTRSLEDAWRRP